MSQKKIYIIAGPNGAGKTTKVDLLLPKGFLETNEFVNADNIARGISPYNFNSKSVNFQAGEQMLKRIKNLIKDEKGFAFETTLSGKSYVRLIKLAKENDYLINLIFLYIENPNLSVARVSQRVKNGGHNIDENDIRRRHHRGISNLVDLYLSVVDTASVFDGSPFDIDIKRDKIIEKSEGKIIILRDNLWNDLLKISKKHL
jgi:predicted ABC-type ATPase